MPAQAPHSTPQLGKLIPLEIREQRWDDYIAPGELVYLQPEKGFTLPSPSLHRPGQALTVCGGQLDAQPGWEWRGEGKTMKVIVHIPFGRYWFN